MNVYEHESTIFLSVFDLVQVRQSSKPISKKQAVELEKCEEILQKLMKYRYSWPFRYTLTDIIKTLIVINKSNCVLKQSQ